MSRAAVFRIEWVLTPAERALLAHAAAGQDADRDQVREVLATLGVRTLPEALELGYELRALAA